jgi:3-dehydroquinate synthase
VKHAVISDREFFAYLEDNVHDIMQMKGGALLRIAEANCKIKGAVIENDAYEAGLRMTLNFGHTIGHAIERLSDYTMPHGKCVSIGMIVEMKIANAVGGFPKKDMGRVKALLEAFGLPTRVPDGISSESIMATATLDKKSRGGKERYSIPSRLGVMAAFGGDYSVHVDERTVREALDGSR